MFFKMDVSLVALYFKNENYTQIKFTWFKKFYCGNSRFFDLPNHCIFPLNSKGPLFPCLKQIYPMAIGNANSNHFTILQKFDSFFSKIKNFMGEPAQKIVLRLHVSVFVSKMNSILIFV